MDKDQFTLIILALIIGSILILVCFYTIIYKVNTIAKAQVVTENQEEVTQYNRDSHLNRLELIE